MELDYTWWILLVLFALTAVSVLRALWIYRRDEIAAHDLARQARRRRRKSSPPRTNP